MSDALYVWCQLYFRGEDGQHYQEQHGEPVEIDISRLDRDNIQGLKTKVKEEEGLECPLSQILVYRPGTVFDDTTKLRPGTNITKIPATDDEHPLIVVAPAPPQQRQREEEQNVSLEIPDEDEFYENAKLPVGMLRKYDLRDYIAAANAQAGPQPTDGLLEYLIGIQTIKDKKEGKKTDINAFAAIIASSGTGKTQLAATAALNYKEKAKTVYLQFGEGGEEQRFYEPHLLPGAKKFRKQIWKFAKIVARNGREENVYVNYIKHWAESKKDKGTCIFVRTLCKLLLDCELPPTCRLKDLKAKIKGKTFLVFLDDVPEEGQKPLFNSVLCLRNTLRYLGIAPILMSTHTGAQHCVFSGSRGSGFPWVHIISILPPYQGSSELVGIMSENERPLVLNLAFEAKSSTVKGKVEHIRKELQKRKINAWKANPVLQLVQLFCTDMEVDEDAITNPHTLVGHHFGRLQQNQPTGREVYYAQEAADFETIPWVVPVIPKVEPLLYLALVTWDESMMNSMNPSVYFPLINDENKAITVREACMNSTEESKFNVDVNLHQGLDDLLEVLVHASLTLASMKTSTNDNEYLVGVPLKEFLPLVRHLMLPGLFDFKPPSLEKLLEDLQVDEMTVPALGGSNSRLPSALAGEMNSLIGFLKRPKNKEMVDGLISRMKLNDHGDVEEDEPFMSIECKNHTGGVNATVLKGVFKRITPNIKVCLVFVSSLARDVFVQTALEDVKACFKENWGKNLDEISILKWDEDCVAPTILQVGGKQFKATEKTELLVVIIAVGLVDKKTLKRKRY